MRGKKNSDGTQETLTGRIGLDGREEQLVPKLWWYSWHLRPKVEKKTSSAGIEIGRQTPDVETTWSPVAEQQDDPSRNKMKYKVKPYSSVEAILLYLNGGLSNFAKFHMNWDEIIITVHKPFRLLHTQKAHTLSLMCRDKQP